MKNRRLSTTTASLFDIDNSFDDERFCRVRINIMHSGKNANNSIFEKDVIENAKESFKNIPVLAEVATFEDENGEYLDYTAHTMHIEENKFNKDECKMIYDEQVVGIVPETNDFEIVYNEDREWYDVFVTAYLYRAYGNYACEILESKGGVTDVSAEILCGECEYDVKEDALVVNEMLMSGVTLLGEHVNPGMEGANAKTFSADENSVKNQMLSFMQELQESLDKYIKLAKGGKEMFEELLEKYGKTVDDIDFEYEGLSDEELEAAFANAFEDEEAVEDVEEDVEEDAEDVKEMADEEAEEVAEDEADEETEDVVEDVEEVDEACGDDDEKDKEKENFEDEDKLVIEISADEKTRALYHLVCETYDSWYELSVYDEYIVMYDYGSVMGYKQNYSEENGTFALVGERTPVFHQWITEEEATALKEMKAKLEKYEAEPSKIEALTSEEYSSIFENEKYKELYSNHFDFSLEEVTAKLDDILLEQAKSHTKVFAVSSTKLPYQSKFKKNKRYGDIFNSTNKEEE